MLHYLPRSAALIIACAALAHCTPQSHPVPQDKPAVPHVAPQTGSADYISALYRTRLHLNAIEKGKALEAIATVKERLATAERKTRNESDLLVELTYLSHGTLSKLYIPTTRGEARYIETMEVLKSMQARNVKPTDFRLVTFQRKQNTAQSIAALDEMTALLKDESIHDESYATIHADRKLDGIYRSMAMRPYYGTAQNRLNFTLQASLMFLQNDSFNAARVAHEQAEKAFRDYRMEAEKDAKLKAHIPQYKQQLASVSEAIDNKDPSLMKKIGKGIDSWWQDMIR